VQFRGDHQADVGMALSNGADLAAEAFEGGLGIAGHRMDLECRERQDSFFESHSMN